MEDQNLACSGGGGEGHNRPLMLLEASPWVAATSSQELEVESLGSSQQQELWSGHCFAPPNSSRFIASAGGRGAGPGHSLPTPPPLLLPPEVGVPLRVSEGCRPATFTCTLSRGPPLPLAWDEAACRHRARTVCSAAPPLPLCQSSRAYYRQAV